MSRPGTHSFVHNMKCRDSKGRKQHPYNSALYRTTMTPWIPSAKDSGVTKHSLKHHESLPEKNSRTLVRPFDGQSRPNVPCGLLDQVLLKCFGSVPSINASNTCHFQCTFKLTLNLASLNFKSRKNFPTKAKIYTTQCPCWLGFDTIERHRGPRWLRSLERISTFVCDTNCATSFSLDQPSMGSPATTRSSVLSASACGSELTCMKLLLATTSILRGVDIFLYDRVRTVMRSFALARGCPSLQQRKPFLSVRTF